MLKVRGNWARSNKYRYSTKEHDPSGLVYFGARYYNPQIGRWITKDPLGMVDGPNVYAYVGNNPVNIIDPWGYLSLKEALKNPRVKALASLGAAKLADYAAKKMRPGKARGVVHLTSAALASIAAYQSVKVAFLSGVVVATPSLPLGQRATALAVAAAFLKLAQYDIQLAQEYLNKAMEDFGYEEVSELIDIVESDVKDKKLKESIKGK